MIAPRTTLILVLMLATSTTLKAAEVEGSGDETAESPAPQATEDTASEAVSDTPAEAPEDPLTARMKEMVVDYYRGIETEPSSEERAKGLESVQMMVLSGVAIKDIARAVTAAVRLHTPGRRVPFEIAVPLRVGTGPKLVDVEQQSGETASAAVKQPRIRLSPEDAPSAEETTRRSLIRKAEESRRSRYGLYRQWRERTRVPRTLISVGIPLLATTYITGFATSGIALLAGAPLTHGQAWLSAIPVVGTALVAGVTDGALGGMAILTLLQGTGLALIVVGLALPMNYPYDKDPTALRIGKKPRGGHALEVRFQPSPTGGGLVGRF